MYGGFDVFRVYMAVKLHFTTNYNYFDYDGKVNIKLDTFTAMIPILNVSLAMNDIIAGTLSIPLYFLVMISLLFFTALSIWISVKFVSQESVIFRG